MDIKAARRTSERTARSVFSRLREGHVNNKVCSFWLEGRCSRNPCRFLHRELPPPQPKQFRVISEDRDFQPKSTWGNPNFYSSKKSPVLACGAAGSVCKSTQDTEQKVSTSGGAGTKVKGTQKTRQELCKFWVKGNCVKGDQCENLHSWFCGNGFTMLAKLEGHNKAVTGIALPSGSDKLYSGGMDKSVRVWDCHTGQCARVVNLEGESGSLISEGPWVFVGLRNAIKAWNTEAQTELTLNGPVGQVCAMAVGNDMLFAGTEDGSILIWKSNCPDLAASLKGHSGAVVSLVVGANRLYSGSMDNTIIVWDTETLQCVQTLNGHTDVVMSVICWDSFLLSGSLDKTIKVWAATESGKLEEVYELNAEHGVLELCGIHDAEAKPILFCSCNDNSVRLYDLPSFTERGRIFAKREVRAIQIGTGGLFFTGDATGQLFVWKLLGESSAVAS